MKLHFDIHSIVHVLLSKFKIFGIFFFQNKVVAISHDKCVLSHLTNEAEVKSMEVTTAISLSHAFQPARSEITRPRASTRMTKRAGLRR